MKFTKRDAKLMAIGCLMGMIIPAAIPKAYSIIRDTIQFSKLYSYSVILKANQVGLLTENDAVIENGILIGRVKSIMLANDHHVIVECRIKNNNQIQSTSIATISRIGIMGEAYVNIRSVPVLIGDKINPKFLNENDTIATSYQPGIAEWLVGDSVNFFQKIDSLYMNRKR